jgi:hypothetical protein
VVIVTKSVCTRMYIVLLRTVSEIELFHVIAHIKERQDALRRATRHVLTRDANCIDADGGLFENVHIILGKLYQVCHLNNKYRY